MKILFMALLFLLPLSTFANEISLKEALALSEKDENSLQSDSLQKLIEAQAKVATNAFPQCIQKLQAMPANFTVAVELSSDGTVSKVWSSNDDFALCFANYMRDDFQFEHGKEKFYTAFSYTHEK